MMTYWDCFKRLGISITFDKAKIKKAYAQKSKLCHPEEKPEEWKLLHEAYQMALSYADNNGGRKNSLDTWQHLDLQKEVDSEKDDFKKEEDVLYQKFFENLDDDIEKRNEQDRRKLEDVLDPIEKSSKIVSLAKWKSLYESEAFFRLRNDETFFERILNQITKKYYFYSAFAMIYDDLLMWNISLQAEGIYEKANKIQRVIEELRFKWVLTPKMYRKMGKYSSHRLWIFWRNLCHIPVWVRLLIYFLVMSFLLTMEHDAVFLVGCYILVEVVLAEIRNGRRKMLKKPVVDQADKKKLKKQAQRKEERKLLKIFAVFFFVICFAGALETCGGTEKWTTQVHSNRVILYAYKYNSNIEEYQWNEVYCFNLINEGLEDERVLVIPENEQDEFEELLIHTDYIQYDGEYKYTSSTNLLMDVNHYFSSVPAEVKDWSEGALGILSGPNNPKILAEPWLNREIYWVDSFEAAE